MVYPCISWPHRGGEVAAQATGGSVVQAQPADDFRSSDAFGFGLTSAGSISSPPFDILVTVLLSTLRVQDG